MCGIVGRFHYKGPGPVDEEAVLLMRDSMSHRGPDDAGIWTDDRRRVCLSQRRLSIIDLSPLGHQPMHGRDGRHTITYNGEIFNFEELRRGLEQKGWTFRSNSDTEVLLALYAEHGPEMCRDLRGMYALAVYDADEGSLFLARDPYGIKPLYYADFDGALTFASSVKAIQLGGWHDTSPDPAGIVSFFVWGHVAGPQTTVRGIRELPAGHAMRVGGSAPFEPRAFYDLTARFRELATERPEGESREILREALEDSVRHHFVSDVPVGLFLSAGLDSTCLLSTAVSLGFPATTLTLGFEEFRDDPRDEVPLAEAVAREFGTDHKTIWIHGSEFGADLEDILAKMDQPSIDGVNTYLVSKYARQAGFTVALSGLGGDELFGGYPSFTEVPAAVSRLRWASRVPGLGRGFRAVAGPILAKRTSPKYAGLLEYGGTMAGAYLLRRGHFLPHELTAFLEPDLVRDGWRALNSLPRIEALAAGACTPHGQVALMEAQWYMRGQLLRDSDWASMAHSVELRVPLVDVRLFERLAPMIAGPRPPTKRDMAASLARPLPDAVLNRPKSGFYVPVRDWLMQSDPTQTDRSIRGFSKVVGRAFGLPLTAR